MYPNFYYFNVEHTLIGRVLAFVNEDANSGSKPLFDEGKEGFWNLSIRIRIQGLSTREGKERFWHLSIRIHVGENRALLPRKC